MVRRTGGVTCSTRCRVSKLMMGLIAHRRSRSASVPARVRGSSAYLAPGAQERFGPSTAPSDRSSGSCAMRDAVREARADLAEVRGQTPIRGGHVPAYLNRVENIRK